MNFILFFPVLYNEILRSHLVESIQFEKKIYFRNTKVRFCVGCLKIIFLLWQNLQKKPVVSVTKYFVSYVTNRFLNVFVPTLIGLLCFAFSAVCDCLGNTIWQIICLVSICFHKPMRAGHRSLPIFFLDFLLFVSNINGVMQGSRSSVNSMQLNWQMKINYT